MNLYRCPFCKSLIKDDIDSLIDHRKDGGDCETNMIELAKGTD